MKIYVGIADQQMQGKKVGKIAHYTAPPYGKRVGLFSAVFKWFTS